MKYTYNTKGTCSSQISFNIDDEGKLSDVRFVGGCNGNLKAIGKLVEGKNAREIAETLRGNICGFKSTSCADQLALAIEQALGA